MEARLSHAAVLAAALVSMGASHRTANFVVRAATKELATEIGEAAEKYRHDLAIDWLGRPMNNWPQPCPIAVEVGPNLGAGGATSFIFDRGRVYGWEMTIQGSRERLLDSVLPHEVTHTIFATYFGRPLPRWADEGASSTVEHDSERSKQQRMLVSFLRSERGIPFNRMFAMKQYPHDILPLYAQGHSLATYLMAQGGKRKFLRFVKDGLDGDNWPAATRDHYGFNNLGELQTDWLDWVRRGSPLPIADPPVQDSAVGRLVSHDARQPAPRSDLVYHEPAGKRAGNLVPVAGSEKQPFGALPRSKNPASADSRGWRRPNTPTNATDESVRDENDRDGSDLLAMNGDEARFDASQAPGPIVSQSHRAPTSEVAKPRDALRNPTPTHTATPPVGGAKRSVYQKGARQTSR